MDSALSAAYETCLRVHRRHDPTYYWATRRLPSEVRPATHALYGADDAGCARATNVRLVVSASILARSSCKSLDLPMPAPPLTRQRRTAPKGPLIGLGATPSPSSS